MLHVYAQWIFFHCSDFNSDDNRFVKYIRRKTYTLALYQKKKFIFWDGRCSVFFGLSRFYLNYKRTLASNKFVFKATLSKCSDIHKFMRRIVGCNAIWTKVGTKYVRRCEHHWLIKELNFDGVTLEDRV